MIGVAVSVHLFVHLTLPLFDFTRLVLIEEIRSWCSEFDFAITSRRGIQKQGPNMGLGPQYGFRVSGLG